MLSTDCLNLPPIITLVLFSLTFHLSLTLYFSPFLTSLPSLPLPPLFLPPSLPLLYVCASLHLSGLYYMIRNGHNDLAHLLGLPYTTGMEQETQ